MKRFSGGFTLVEILVVLALIGVLAMVVVPNLGGLVGRGSEQAYNSDRSAIQAAVDSYYTDPTTRVDGARQYPTKSGSGTNPTYSATRRYSGKRHNALTSKGKRTRYSLTSDGVWLAIPSVRESEE